MTTRPVETYTFHDPSRPSWTGEGPRPVRVHVMRPDDTGAEAAAVVVSHGTGGAAVQMSWLSEPLAAAGFVAIGLDHHGNNFVDGYVAEGFARWWERPLDVTFALDRLRETEALARVGVAGFSLGGYTAAAVVGARIDLGRYELLIAGELPSTPTPEYPGLEDELRGRLTHADLATWTAEAVRDYRDERVEAAFVVCPSLGRLLDEQSLAAVERSVAVRWTDADEITPSRENAEVYAGLIPGADGCSVSTEAGHYTFLSDSTEFADVRERVAADAVAFFDRHLRRR